MNLKHYIIILHILSSITSYQPYLLDSALSQTEFYRASCPINGRDQFIDAISDYQTSQSLNDHIDALYNADQELVAEFTLNLDIPNLYKQLTKSSGSNFINFIILYIGAGLLILLVPCFLTCICCPQCFNKPHQNHRKSKGCFQFFSFILSLALIILLIYVVLYSLGSRQIYRNFKCSAAMITNNLINGNVDVKHQTQFAGLQTLNKTLTSLEFNYNTFVEILQTLRFEGEHQLKRGEELQNEVLEIPEQFQLSYQFPLLSDQPQRMIKSQISNNLKISKQKSTLIGNVNTELESLTWLLSQINEKANEFISYRQEFSTRSQSVQFLSKSLREAYRFNFNIQKTFQLFEQSFSNIIQIVFYTLFGCFALLLFVQLILSCCATNRKISPKCMTFVCIIIWLLTLAMFALSFFASIAVPSLYYSCQSVNQILLNSSKFESQYNSIIDDSDLVYIMSACLKGQSIPPFEDSQDNIIIKAVDSIYSLSQSTARAQNKLNEIVQTTINSTEVLRDYIYNNLQSATIDIQDQQVLSQFYYIAIPQQYTCSGIQFRDQWVYNHDFYNQRLACQGALPQVDKTTCSRRSYFEDHSSGCHGCINTVSILELYKERRVLTGLQNRYSNCSSNQNLTGFSFQLANLWENYYLPKLNYLQPILERTKSFDQNLTSYGVNLQSQYNPKIYSFNRFYNSSSLASINYSFISTGKYCFIVRADIFNSHRILCGQGLNYLQTIKVMLFILSFLGLLNICCLSCLGCRNDLYRENLSNPSQKNKPIGMIKHPYFNNFENHQMHVQSQRQMKF